MDSKQTGESQSKKQSVHDWLPDDGKSRGKNPTDGNKSKFIREFLREDIIEEPPVLGVDTANSTANIDDADTNDSVDTVSTVPTEKRKDTEDAALREQSVQTVLKRTSSKQRKESLEEYRQAFLIVPKLEDRKPVFISREVRDELDEIARKLGGRRMSVSGFIENLVRHHLEIYREDVEIWKKL
ncbi:hypothetical protein GGR21_000678 [Dysgonomonas hofstadii]|uniref:DUF3408 domain-containing protein n=1 Tax=Dysgonomonas hofstadii TaxID=637886 RepID=A0A840CHV5_9BACT|nr:DUF3408 domain-containing protein [Dysgonomonas hofstadii]MBB4034791.1 hypothetical protein [Dysgonomonas hofstadii]